MENEFSFDVYRKNTVRNQCSAITGIESRSIKKLLDEMKIGSIYDCRSYRGEKRVHFIEKAYRSTRNSSSRDIFIYALLSSSKENSILCQSLAFIACF